MNPRDREAFLGGAAMLAFFSGAILLLSHACQVDLDRCFARRPAAECTP